MSTPAIRKALDQIPEYLLPYTTTQKPDMYSLIDHSVWRFIMKISSDFFADTAHTKYLEGLKETGISIERIPLVSEMDAKLKKIGWRAVAVSGFIPPAVFLEFMALGIMPIACEIRKLENIAYTPAPDIVHEAAGHAPIVADPDYNDYVRSYGEVAVKAIFSKKDMDLYEAIKKLSDVKESPRSTQDAIDEAQKGFEKAFAAVDYISEANQLSRMAWWTIEYGLVGTPQDFKVYGAGLLSSMGESFHSFDEKVLKVPLTTDCVNMGFDITRPQPQLYVATSFESARDVLESYAKTMAFRTGGISGLSKARVSEMTTTSVLDCGLQISGTVTAFGIKGDTEVTSIQLNGPLQLCENDQEIAGFEMSKLPKKLKVQLGVFSPKDVQGTVEKEQTLKNGKKFLWVKTTDGYTLATASTKVSSVYGGPADRALYIKSTWNGEYASKEHASNLSPEQNALNEIFGTIRDIREKKLELSSLNQVFSKLQKDFPKEWLSRFELVELALTRKEEPEYFKTALAELKELRGVDEAHKELIDRGLKLLRKHTELEKFE
ncbi:MAG: aromatic amino acid hydroxylase [Bdellovibrionota bacterium]